MNKQDIACMWDTRLLHREERWHVADMIHRLGSAVLLLLWVLRVHVPSRHLDRWMGELRLTTTVTSAEASQPPPTQSRRSTVFRGATVCRMYSPRKILLNAEIAPAHSLQLCPQLPPDLLQPLNRPPILFLLPLPLINLYFFLCISQHVK